MLAILSTLRERENVDPRRSGLFGFSQGAWVAPLAASRSRDVSFLVLVASTGVSPARQMRYGTEVHLRAAGFGDREAAALGRLRRAYEAYNAGRLPRGEAQRAVDEVAGEPWFPLAYVPASLPPQPGFWRGADWEPEPVFARVRVPALLFYGETDEWSPVDESIAAWRRAAAAAGNADVAVVRLAGTGHHPTLGGGDDEAAIAPDYERTLLEWLGARIGRLGG